MNYYEHHIGDYAAATAHLTLIEDAIYTRMMRRYYLTEQPLPADIAVVARLVGARSEPEIAAVEAILCEFFFLEDDGYHQKRCDADIAKYLEKQGKARASAAARWANASPSDSECNANAMRTHSEGNAHQTPNTKHQKEKKKPSPSAAALPDPPEFVNADAWAGFVAMRSRIRHPLTPRAAALIHSSLTKYRADGHNPNDILDNSTRNGWRDVFAPRDAAKARDGPAMPASKYGNAILAIEKMKHGNEKSDFGPDTAVVVSGSGRDSGR